MSSSITIPSRTRADTTSPRGTTSTSSTSIERTSTASSSSPGTDSSLGTTPSLEDSMERHAQYAAGRYTAREKGKMAVRDGTAAATSEASEAASGSPSGNGQARQMYERRGSSMSSSLSKSEQAVVDVGDTDGNMRLITFLTSSQGFEWNRSIFLPHYARHRSRHADEDYGAELERRQDPVEEIWVTEEEVGGMFPSDD